MPFPMGYRNVMKLGAFLAHAVSLLKDAHRRPRPPILTCRTPFFFNPFSQDSKERLRHPWEQERPKCEYRSTHPCDPATPNKRLCPKIQKPKLNEKNDRDIKSICQPRFVENRTPEMLIHCDAMPKKRRQRERDRPKTSEK